MTHSPEPWKLGEQCESSGTILDKNGKTVGAIRNHWGIRLPSDSEATGDDDIRRIIACVNACRGIETATLEKFLIGSISRVPAAKDEEKTS